MHIRDLFKNPGWRGLLTGIICALIVWLLSLSSMMVGLEEWTRDASFIWRGKRSTTAKVVIIGLDEKSLEQLCRRKPESFLSPELAEIVTYAHKQGASAIGLDIMVPQEMFALRDIAEEGGAGDARPMGRAVSEAGNVVLPCWPTPDGCLVPLPQWRFFQHESDRDSLTDMAFVNLLMDGDDFVRRQPLAMHAKLDEDGPEVPLVPFALAVYAVSRHAKITLNDVDQPLIDGQPIPTDSDGTMRINYVGPPRTFPHLSFQDVLEAARSGKPLPQLDGAVVLIGETAPSSHDDDATPYSNQHARWFPAKGSGRMAGTEIHANVLATIQDRAYIRTPWWLSSLPTLLLLGAVLGHAFARLSLGRGLLLAVAHHFGWKALALGAFVWLNWSVPVAAMLLMGAILYGVTFTLRWLVVRDMFGRFKSQAIVRELEANPARMTPGGDERVLTVLFADVRDFTTFSETHPAQQVVKLLNTYFNLVVPAIEAHGGTLNQYMGDGVMVLFGAPDPYPDHAERAVRAAREMVRLVQAHMKTWAELGLPDMRIGAGINTGKAVVGVVGSRNRLDYTAIGDTTNTAARIEAQNKAFGTQILISATTRAALGDEKAKQLGCDPQGREAHLKGKRDVLMLYEVVGSSEA
jgi:adenylate cyclase